MKNICPLSSTAQVPSAQFVAKPVMAIFSRSHAAIWHATRLLGGYESARLVDRCIATLERDQTLTNCVQIMLDQILDILSLEEVDDPEKPFMGFFAAIDPSDPVVEEICLLTDALREAIEEARQRKAWASKRQKVPEAA